MMERNGKDNYLSCLLFAAPHKHQVNIKATKANLEYHSHMVGNGSGSTDQAILPFRLLSLVFDHINYFVDMPKVTSSPLQTLPNSCINSCHPLTKKIHIFHRR
uniref:Uncharacterized protein n=1 Tax=Arundo donax TaxID=35708 RepID=A0A0A9DQ78_ARUDO